LIFIFIAYYSTSCTLSLAKEEGASEASCKQQMLDGNSFALFLENACAWVCVVDVCALLDAEGHLHSAVLLAVQAMVFCVRPVDT
jgi:hypothetical protein